MADEEKQTIIIDNGSSISKVGFGGDEYPRTIFPTCIGYSKCSDNNSGEDKHKFLVGADAEAKRNLFNLYYPIERGNIRNWDDMEKIWKHIYPNELCADSEEHKVLITEPPMNPKENKEKIAQIMFETLKVPGLYIANPGILGLYSCGRFNGISIDLGDSITQFIPGFEGYPLPHSIQSINLGGRDLTEFMMKLLNDTAKKFSNNGGKEIIKKIKESSTYVALDFEKDSKSVNPFDYELPDGTHVIITDQRIKCPEALFKPAMIDKDENGIEQICNDSIQKCDIDIQKDLYNNIILCGGTSFFNGLKERLTKEIKSLAPDSMKEKVKIIASPERKFSVWIGGSICASISTFEDKYITKAEYQEFGLNIVYNKCLY